MAAVKSKYEVFAAKVEQQVAIMNLKPGQPLPSIRRLMSLNRISLATVMMGLCLQIIVLSAYVSKASAEDRPEWFIPDTFFGTTTHVNRTTSEGTKDYGSNTELLAMLGIRTVRLNFRLFVLTGTEGNINYSNWITDSIELGDSLGLDQMGMIDSPPEWMAESGTIFPSDAKAQAFEDFMYEFATHYQGKVTNWEAPNEIDIAAWGGERYATMLEAFYNGVKRADPNNTVILGTFNNIESNSLTTAYQGAAALGKNLGDYYDVLNTHPYTWSALPEAGGYVDKIEAVRAVMNQYGDDKPIWVSEIGWNGVEPSTYNGMPMLDYLRQTYLGVFEHEGRSTSEEDQARAYARLYLISASVPSVERVYAFGLDDLEMNGPIWGEPSPDPVAYMEVVGRSEDDTELRPKPAFYSLKTVIEMIGETTYKGEIDLGSEIGALKFLRGSEVTVALWNRLDGNSFMQLARPGIIESITSMVGSPVELSGGDTLFFSGAPIYVKVTEENLGWLESQLAAPKPVTAWAPVTYDDNAGEWWGGSQANVNRGADTGGYYYTSDKPETGDWTFNYEFRAAAYQLGVADVWPDSPSMSIWSADNAAFHVYTTTSANGDLAADIQIKVVLSEAINGAAWTPRPDINITGGAGLAAYSEYSLNGTDWTTVATYSVSGLDETTYNLTFSPTTELYLRLRADAGGVYYSLNYGSITFAVPEPATMAVLGFGALAVLVPRRRRR